ncbi:MYBBP1A isoform 7, partial [Pan troglodytes]
MPERAVFRLRKWIIFRLVSIVDSLHLEMEEALTEQVARFCLFHSFFVTKKPTSQIPETKHPFSFPLENQAREAVSSAFFSLLQTLSTQFKQAPGQTQGGQPWTYHLVQFADLLLNHSHNVTTVTPFTAQQRQVNGAPGSPTEPAGQKQHEKALPKKGVLGKSPLSALARKKARLSLVIRSPSLLQSGAKKKKVQTLRFTISSSK